jgi:Binding-protein-dependent transport system inner membrane component
VAIAFFLYTGAYYGEILAGIDSVPTGQIEAARSTGLSRLQAMTYVVLPQAVRNVLPDLLSRPAARRLPIVLASPISRSSVDLDPCPTRHAPLRANRPGLVLDVGDEGRIAAALQPLLDEGPENDLKAHRELEGDRRLGRYDARAVQDPSGENEKN